MKNHPADLFITYLGDDLELENELTQFVENELDGSIWGKNTWKCNLNDTSWNSDTIRNELIRMVQSNNGSIRFTYFEQDFFLIRQTRIEVTIRKKDGEPKPEVRTHTYNN